MHALHRILVNTDHSGEDIALVRDYAERQTEDFCGVVFDWRETDTAGRWSNDYPQNVIFAKDNIESFVGEIQSCRDKQQKMCDYYVQNIVKRTDSISEFVWNSKNGDNNSQDRWYRWCFMQLGNLLYGKYDFDSGFYDTEDGTSRITEETIEKIKNYPNKYALVLFDYHF